MDRTCATNVDHCPWMGVCIGHNNRRFFIRFLVYLDCCCFLVVWVVVRERLASIVFGYCRGGAVCVYGYYWGYYCGVWYLSYLDCTQRQDHPLVLRNPRWLPTQHQFGHQLLDNIRHQKRPTGIITHIYPNGLQRLRMEPTQKQLNNLTGLKLPHPAHPMNPPTPTNPSPTPTLIPKNALYPLPNHQK